MVRLARHERPQALRERALGGGNRLEDFRQPRVEVLDGQHGAPGFPERSRRIRLQPIRGLRRRQARRRRRPRRRRRGRAQRETRRETRGRAKFSCAGFIKKRRGPPSGLVVTERGLQLGELLFEVPPRRRVPPRDAQLPRQARAQAVEMHAQRRGHLHLLVLGGHVGRLEQQVQVIFLKLAAHRGDSAALALRRGEQLRPDHAAFLCHFRAST